MLKSIDTLLGQIRSLMRPDLWPLVEEKLRIEWTYNSNAIEGNTLTLGETAFFLREGLTSEGRPLKDYLEAKNHAEAIDVLHEVISNERPISEGLIKELHAVLLKDIEYTYARGGGGQMIKKPLTPGKYKTWSNHVLTLSGKVHHYTDPLHVKDEMEKLVHWLNRDAIPLHPVERAALFHYRFVAIHPFDDGNGRLARILMNLILMKASYPPCVIRNARRRYYIGALEMADTMKNTQGFIHFVAEELKKTLEDIFGILRESKEIAFETPKKLNFDERKTLIVEALKGGEKSIGQLMEIIPHVRRPTFKKDLQTLVKQGKIYKSGFKKGVIYFLK